MQGSLFLSSHHRKKPEGKLRREVPDLRKAWFSSWWGAIWNDSLTSF